MTAAKAGAAMAADGVDLVDEDDAGGIPLPLVEEIADTRGADADKHLDEIRTRKRKEGNARLAGDGLREKRLTRPRRAEK